MTDGELLHRYAATRDGGAFAEIVRRHGAMVHATARRLARDDAEDVTQAVFLLLAQKAATLAHYRNVAAWLHKAARYCASNARRTRGRRERRLAQYQEAAMRQGSTAAAAGAGADDAAASELLDAGLAKLKEDQRQAVLLRYIEGLSLDEAAERLGINAAAVAKRAERGVARLREYFTARGVTLSDAALAATPIPASMLASLNDVAVGAAPAKGAAIAAATAKSMTLAAAAKVAAVLVLAAVGVTATVGIGAALRSNSPKPAQAATTSVTSPSPRTAPAATATATAPAAAPARFPLTQDGGRAIASALARGLRERDEEAVARLLIASSPDEARAAAAGLIAQIRDTAYAQFPERLDQVGGNSSFMSSQAGEMLEATVDTNTPTDADVQRLAIRLQPLDGQWRVRDAKIISGTVWAENARTPTLATLPAATAKVPPGTYGKAAEIFERFQSRLDSPDEPAEMEKEKPRIVENFRLAQEELRQLAAALKPTDLAIPDEHVTLVNAWLERARGVLEKDGAAAFEKFGESVEKDRGFVSASKKIWGMSETLNARAEAESETVNRGSRPPSFAPPVELTLSWDNSKQTVPGPVTMPQWFRDSPTFKTWQNRHNVETFRTRDDAGNVYEIHCTGGVKEQEGGKSYDVIPTISLFRPDGTLAASADYDHRGRVTEWGTFDKTGKVFVTKVIMQNQGADPPAPPTIRQVIFFDEKKNQRIWQTDKQNVVSLELGRDPVGGSVKILHRAPRPRGSATTRTTTRATSG